MAAQKKVSKKTARQSAVNKKSGPDMPAKKGPDNSPKGMEKLADSLKKGSKKKAAAKKTSKKKTVKKKGPVVKSSAQIKRDLKAQDKKVERKIVGKTVLGKLQMLKLNPRNIVVVDGFNPRIDRRDITDLMKSIKVNGVQTPIKVRRVGKHYELIDGERRLTSVLKLGMKEIPGIEIRGKKSTEELLSLALVSNDGKPFAPVEEADAYRRLIKAGWSARKIATATGKGMQHVKNRLELISAHPDVAAAVKKGKLSVNLGIAIAKKVKGGRAQKRVVKKATKSTAGRKKVAAAIGKPNLKRAFEVKAVSLRNRLDKLVQIVNKRRRKKADKIPKQLASQVTYFSKHRDKEIRAAFVAGGSYTIAEVLGKARARTTSKKKKVTARGKPKKSRR